MTYTQVVNMLKSMHKQGMSNQEIYFYLRSVMADVDIKTRALLSPIANKLADSLNK